MTEMNRSSNEKSLLSRKARQGGYQFCPFCSASLKELLIDGHHRMVCSSQTCDFVYYHNPVPAAGAVIVKDRKVLLVRRAHPPAIGDWCIPAGFMEWSEHPSETAVREVFEETGATIEIDSFFEVYVGNDDPRTNAVLILYLARIVSGTLVAGDDAMELAWFPLGDLPTNIAFQAHRQALADYKARYQL